jgi:MATE family multidrug resistance protein
LNRRILRLAVPNIISNLSVPLLSSVDTALLGHLPEIYYLGALAVGGILFNFIYWGFGFLRMGTTGLTAQAYGTRNDDEINLILVRTVLIALSAGLLLILCRSWIARVGFSLIEASADVEFHARRYYDIRIFAAPATLTLYAVHGWFLGMQNARFPLLLTVVVNVINIVCNVIFVFGFGMNSDGVAWGTVIAQYSGLLFAVFLLFKRYRAYLYLPQLSAIFEATALRRIFAVNADIFVRTLALILTFSYFTAESAGAGELILAVNSILLQLISIIAYGVDGFAFAAESLVGCYIGARDPKNLGQAVKFAFLWGIGLGAGFTVVYAASGDLLLRFFTSQKDVIEAAAVYLPWIIIAPLTNSFCFIWDGIYIGATATRPMRNAMLACTFLVFLPVYWLSKATIGNHSLWLAMTVFMLARAITLTWYAKDYIFDTVKNGKRET